MTVTLGLTFLSLMSSYWWKNYILNFKKLINLTFRDALKEPQKLSVTKIYSVGFNHYADFDADYDAQILCKKIKQSGFPWKFWGCRVFHYRLVGLVLPLSVKKRPNLPWPPTPTNFYIHQVFTLLLLDVGIKRKNDYKNFQQQNKSIFLGNLYKIFLSVVNIFRRTCNSWPWRFAAGRKISVPH